jgi:predicted metal-dependent phosphoesterase TrpH
MDVVTITDHDSINGCLEVLSRVPDATDFIIGEEVSCRMPPGDIQVHLGVYGMTETLHRELRPLRGNVFDVMARLRDADVFCAVNHLFHFYRRQVPLESYLALLAEVPALEVRNGTMTLAQNALLERIVAHLRRAHRDSGWPGAVGGSDAHTLRRVGRTWTEAPARTAGEFLDALKNGHGRVGGDHGGARAVSGDTYGVILRYYGSLLGLGPSQSGPLHRAGCLAFSMAALPAQFLPWLISVVGKRRETRIVAEAEEALAQWLEGELGATARLKTSEESL